MHAPYLVNFGSPTEATLRKSVDAIAHSLARGAAIGARGVVVHAGSCVAGAHRRPGRQQRLQGNLFVQERLGGVLQLAVVLVDYWMKRGDYGDESVFYDTKHQRWQGALAMAIGLAVSVWLFASNELYVGYVAFNYPQFGDLTFVVGFVITGVLYYAFNMMSPRKAAAGSRAA